MHLVTCVKMFLLGFFQENNELKFDEHTDWLAPNISVPTRGNLTNFNPCK
jgi:hypothetical protein